MFELMIYGHVICVHFATAKKKRDISSPVYMYRCRVGQSEKLTRLKIAADILMAFAGEFFYRRNRRHRVAIKLSKFCKLKSVLNPPEATAINRRR